jgi:hypothetical protein
MTFLGTNEPFPKLFICADGDPLNGPHWLTYAWTVGLIVESSLLSLALFKAWSRYYDGTGSKLIRNLTRDSIMYFVL